MLEQFSSDTDEEDIWESFLVNGSVEVEYGGGLVQTFVGLMFGAEDDEDGFYAGYREADGCLSDSTNIPESVYLNMFDDVDLKGVEIEWNAAENFHAVEGSMKKAMPIIAAVLTANGFVGEGKYAPSKVKPLPAKTSSASGKLKSEDHIEAIMSLVNEDHTVTDFIWSLHKDDEDFDEVPTPSTTKQLGGGLVMITQGGTKLVSNGKKLHANEEAYWAYVKKNFKHWPVFPLTRVSQWKREYRKKVGGALERRFKLFVHDIVAITREEDGVITSIALYGITPFDGRERPEVLLKQRDFR